MVMSTLSLDSSSTVCIPVNAFVLHGTYLFAYLLPPQDLQLPEGKKYCISSVLRHTYPHFYIFEIRIAFGDVIVSLAIHFLCGS